MTPSCSVVVPVFDGRRFLPELLDSCKEQGLEKDAMEIVAVISRSLDGSKELLRSIGGDVRVVETSPTPTKNEARNLGLLSSRGRFVKFLDQDDVLCRSSLRSEVDVGEVQDADIVVSGWLQGDSLNPGVSTQWLAPLFEQGLDSLLAGEAVPNSAALYRREYLADVRWDESMAKLDDWDFFLSAALRGGKIVRRDEPAYLWRQHPGQQSRTFDMLGNAREFYHILDKLESALAERGQLTEPRRHRLAQYRYKELRVLCRFDRVAFEAEVERILSLSSDFVPLDEEPQAWIRSGVRWLGLRRAMLAHTRVRSWVKDGWRRSGATGSRPGVASPGREKKT